MWTKLQEPTNCPVCKTYLGMRNKQQVTYLFCKDCDTEFIYYPNESLPKSNVHPVLDPKVCDCPNCKAQRESPRPSQPINYNEDDFWAQY